MKLSLIDRISLACIQNPGTRAIIMSPSAFVRMGKEFGFKVNKYKWKNDCLTGKPYAGHTEIMFIVSKELKDDFITCYNPIIF